MAEEQEQPAPIDPLTIGELISLADAAEKSGFSEGYLRQIAISGRLRAKKIARNWLTTIAAVEEYSRTRKFIYPKDKNS
jgi:hypothetical protein